jgi:molybdopterin molybdotransferase
MKPLNQALQTLLDDARGRAGEELLAEQQPVMNCLGRVLAQEVVSSINVPPYDNSQMDGYAGVAVEMNNALEPLVVSQRLPAGTWARPLEPNTVARIFTGAPIPPGANAVIMQEQVRPQEDGRIQCLKAVQPGQNIRPLAGDLRAGQVVLPKGRRLSAADLALCASVGCVQIRVYQPLRVAVFSSGDELRQPGEPLGPGQIYDSNRPMLLNLLRGLGIDPTDLGCLPDRLDATRQALGQAAATHQVILTCGGVSVGEEDHIKAAISAQGQLDLWKVAIKPGKPFAYGQVGSAAFLGLPGNPVAAWATFLLLVRPYLLARGGAQVTTVSAFSVPAAFDWPTPDPRQEFLRGWIDENGCAQIHQRQNSAVLSSVTESSGLIDVPPSTPIAAGDFVRFLPYTGFLS